MRYPGGKGKCFQRLINLMPPHRTYIESHLGGGAVLRHKRPAEVNIGVDVDHRVISRWRRGRYNGCRFVHADAVAFLEEFSFDRGELVYADPPYFPQERRRSRVYRHDYTEGDHERLLEVLQTLPCMVMISGYDNSLYGKCLADWRKVSFDAKTHAGVREESVWLNFEPPDALHDGSYLGATFRERQTIRRRHSRVVARFDRMRPVERHHLLRLLNERFLGGGGDP